MEKEKISPFTNLSLHEMSVRSIPQPLRELLAKLEFLSMLKQDLKPCMHDFSFVESWSWYGAYKRTFTGENRSDMVIQINEIIEKTIIAMEEYQGTEFLSLILAKLSNAKTGIETLKTTYKNYPKVVADISICVDNINMQLDILKNKIHQDSHPIPIPTQHHTQHHHIQQQTIQQQHMQQQNIQQQNMQQQNMQQHMDAKKKAEMTKNSQSLI